jgi:dTDP-4-dehydrorhamnose reductase
LDAIQPDLIVNAAAYTAVDRAESEPDLARRINALSVGALGDWAAGKQVPVIHFSSNYVFDGENSAPYEEGDETNPLSVYGDSKKEGETLLLRSGAPVLIIRTAWVYSAGGKNFLNTIRRLSCEQEELQIVDDQIGTPTSARQIASFVSAILRDFQNKPKISFRETPSLVHFTAAGSASWHGFACAIVDGLRARGVKLRVKAVDPISTAHYPAAAKRPRDARLSLQRARDVFGVAPLDWRAALDVELDRLASC